MLNNPYSLAFGKEPGELLNRYPDNIDIIENFESDNSNHVYMITGIRGSGKTVMMTSIAKHFKNDKSWIVLDLSPDIDLLSSFASELGNNKDIYKKLKLEKISVSLYGINIEIKNVPPITDAKIAVTRMLEIAKKENKKVLVTIDEVINNNSVKIFTSIFQILLREELPVYLLMTGLHENIRALQDEKTLTFLYRAPRIELQPINLGTIARNYRKTFEIDDISSREMASLTCGYPFAFQVLGYLTWEENGNYKDTLDTYKEHLYDYVYDKLWNELSPKEQQIVIGISELKERSTEKIKEKLELKQNEFNPYRKRLLDKGILYSPNRAKLEFTLPFFDEFVLENYQ